jgi:ketosteroid isomerase-like protein
VDTDLEQMTRDELLTEVRKLRAGIRVHRDSSGQDLCWHHPDLWGLLPEQTDPVPVVPHWPQFMLGCVRYRQSLDQQAPTAPRTSTPYDEASSPETAVVPGPEASNLATIRSYLASLEGGAVGAGLATYFTSNARQHEFPNRLNPGGGASDLATLLRRAEQGRRLLSGQRYEIHLTLAHGSHVAVEATWTGTLAAPLGALQQGATLKAHVAMFFELRDGRIRLQRNYDCFEP